MLRRFRLTRSYSISLLRRWDKTELKSTEDDYHTVVLLKDAPPQTISFEGGGRVDVPTHRNPVLDAIEGKLKVNGVEESWIFDTGANLSTVSA